LREKIHFFKKMSRLFLLCFISQDFLPIRCTIKDDYSFGPLLLDHEYNQQTSFDVLDQTKCFTILNSPYTYAYMTLSCDLVTFVEPRTAFHIMVHQEKPKVTVYNFGYASSSFIVENAVSIFNLKMIPPKNCQQETAEAVNRNMIGTSGIQLFVRMIAGLI
jgi:hypothetical protein